MAKIKVKIKKQFHKDFLVTLKGNQFMKEQITEVDDSDAEVKNYLTRYEDFIDIIDDEVKETPKEETPKEETPKEEVDNQKEKKESKESEEDKKEDSEQTLIDEGSVKNTIVDEVKKE